MKYNANYLPFTESDVTEVYTRVSIIVSQCLYKVLTWLSKYFLRYVSFYISCLIDPVTLTFGQGHYSSGRDATPYLSEPIPKISEKSAW